jgi:Zn-finger nucleic acid-binding protein
MPDLMQKLREFEFIACPRCGDGVFSDDEEGMELLTMLGLPSLQCVHCLYEFSVYELIEDLPPGDRPQSDG